MQIKANSVEEHSISIDMEFEIFCRVFGDKEVSVIQDMYSPSRNLSVNQNTVSTMVNLKSTKSYVNIREKVRIDNDEYTKIADARILSVNVTPNILMDRVQYEGEMNVRFILLNEDESSARAQDINIPFSASQDIQGISKESKLETFISPVSQDFIKDGNEVSIKVDLEILTNSYDLENINVIDSISENEANDENPYSMVIYFVKPGDSLWKIAKKYKSTVQDISRINGIEDERNLAIGTQLFIPKSVTMR